MVTSAPRIRVIAIAIAWRGDELLVERIDDSVTGAIFYRPPGGAVEFGEPASEALAREMKEELSAQVHVQRQIGIVENIFTYLGEAGHEVVFLFETIFTDASFYTRDELPLDEEGLQSTAIWRPLATFGPGAARLVPDGLYEILSRERAAG